jgi:cytochrome P450
MVRLLPSLADDVALNSRKAAATERARLLAQGRAVIKKLQAMGATAKQWREVLDEPGARQLGVQRAVWTAIREDHGGQLMTPAGHLVGSHRLVLEVLRDDGRRFSVREARRRIVRSLGRFHLGMDSFSAEYRREAPSCNRALKAICERESFDLARVETAKRLRALVVYGPTRIDLVRDLFEQVTAAMAPHWFGLPDGECIAGDGSDWQEIGGRKPRFPGDFWNSSRYAFNPFTSEETRRLSEAHGQAVVKAAIAWVDKHERKLTAPVAKALADDCAAYPENSDVGRVLAGAMLGWVATTLGNAARIFEALLSSGDLGRARLLWLAKLQGLAEPEQAFDEATRLFGDAMWRTRAYAPVPECKHREVGEDGVTLDGKALARGTMVIVSLESAAAERAEAGIIDSYIPFGMAPGKPDTPHGCPGRAMALGHLLGMLAGMMEAVDMRYAGRFAAEIRPG